MADHNQAFDEKYRGSPAYEDRIYDAKQADDLEERLEILADVAWEVADDEGIDVQQAAYEVGARDFVGVNEAFAMTLPKVLEHTKQFVEEYDKVMEPSRADRDEEWLKAVSPDSAMDPNDVTHTYYYTLQQMYGEAIIEKLNEEHEEERVYRAVYERMYELCKDIRYVKYQMLCENEPQMTSPKKYVERHGGVSDDDGIEWTMDNVERIAFELVEASLGSIDNCKYPDEEFPDDSIEGMPYRGDELRAIVDAVEGDDE